MFRKSTRLLIGLLGVAVLGCNGYLPTSSTAPPAAGAAGLSAGVHQPSFAIGRRDVCKLGGKEEKDDQDIGPEGGTISVGYATLVVPAGAVPKRVHFSMHAVGNGNPAVQFKPEGLKFPADASPVLTFNTDCIGNPLTANIVYTDDHGKILERLITAALTAHTVSAEIHHFSGYAVDF